MDEQTNSREEARRALAEARSATKRTEQLLERSRQAMGTLTSRHEANHFKDTFLSIIQGRR